VTAKDKAAHEYYILLAVLGGSGFLFVRMGSGYTQAYVYGEFGHLQYAEVREGLRFSLNKNKGRLL
jgi:hypothetical protein